jgi:hypothetical protein
MDGLCCDDLFDLVGQVPFVFMGLVGIKFWRWHFVPWYFDNWLVILYCFAITHWNITPNVAKHLMECNIQHKQCTSYKCYILLTLILARLSYLTVAMFFSICASSRTTYCIRRILNIFRSSAELPTMLYLHPKERLLSFPVQQAVVKQYNSWIVNLIMYS